MRGAAGLFEISVVSRAYLSIFRGQIAEVVWADVGELRVVGRLGCLCFLCFVVFFVSGYFVVYLTV